MNYSLVANSCVSGFIYQFFNPGLDKMFIDYTNPFISAWFPEDEQFVRFCERYDYFISLTPRFGEPTTCWSWYRDTGSFRNLSRKIGIYPVMFLGDIEIHWIHEHGQMLLMRKYTERLRQSLKFAPIFLWSDAEMFNLHTETERNELMNRFCRIQERKIFLTKFRNEAYEGKDTRIVFIPEWEDKLQTDRHRQNFMNTWYDHPTLARHFKTNMYEDNHNDI